MVTEMKEEWGEQVCMDMFSSALSSCLHSPWCCFCRAWNILPLELRVLTASASFQSAWPWILTHMFFETLDLGLQLVIFRVYSRICAQGSFLGNSRRPHEVPGDSGWLSARQVSALHVVLLFQHPKHCVLLFLLIPLWFTKLFIVGF